MGALIPLISITSEDKTILLDLYKITIEEYRFQVSLNWDRSKFYILLNSGLIIATCGLLRAPGFKFAEFSTAPLFMLGLLSSCTGLQTLLKGIEYRRTIIFNKFKLEKKLAEFIDEDFIAISTAKGMQQAGEQRQEKFINRPPRIGTISYFLAALFIIFTATNAIALIFLAWQTRS